MLVSETLGFDFPADICLGRLVADAYGVGYDTWKGHGGVAERCFVIRLDDTISL